MRYFFKISQKSHPPPMARHSITHKHPNHPNITTPQIMRSNETNREPLNTDVKLPIEVEEEKNVEMFCFLHCDFQLATDATAIWCKLIASYQAFNFIGMPECNVNLAQCVTYLALAPKSVVLYHAIEAIQRLVKGTKKNEAVPMHLRNAPTQLMKDHNYDCQAEPTYFLPPSLQGQKFLKGLRRTQGPD
uniref:MgsA AAA+ ATPase C-terminal domain-containing protein n=1 Tax=Physcomitrium patens TaxID=3218 RepID=A0A2K1KD37_PHYPA|nr:hypothetical protein PHYPA_010888 [Physcomitrium patens]